jgi:hypothetical protein
MHIVKLLIMEWLIHESLSTEIFIKLFLSSFVHGIFRVTPHRLPFEQVQVTVIYVHISLYL